MFDAYKSSKMIAQFGIKMFERFNPQVNGDKELYKAVVGFRNGANRFFNDGKYEEAKTEIVLAYALASEKGIIVLQDIENQLIDLMRKEVLIEEDKKFRISSKSQLVF